MAGCGAADVGRQAVDLQARAETGRRRNTDMSFQRGVAQTVQIVCYDGKQQEVQAWLSKRE